MLLDIILKLVPLFEGGNLFQSYSVTIMVALLIMKAAKVSKT